MFDFHTFLTLRYFQHSQWLRSTAFHYHEIWYIGYMSRKENWNLNFGQREHIMMYDSLQKKIVKGAGRCYLRGS